MVEDAGHGAAVGGAAGFGATPPAAVVEGGPQTLGGLNGLTNKNFFWAWFLAVNASFLVLAIFLPFAVAFPFIGIAGAIFSLFASKWLAMRAHRIQVIDPADRFSWVIEIVLTLAHVVVSAVVLFLGSLVTKAFSRAREFRADALAAHLVGSDHMAGALESISREEPLIPREQLGYATFKISGAPGIAEVLSTHPPVAKRIAALRAMALPGHPNSISSAVTVDACMASTTEGGLDARLGTASSRGGLGDGRRGLWKGSPGDSANVTSVTGLGCKL